MNDSILGLNGERLDPVSGATHLGNGYRAYNPALMRFHCPDDLSPFGAGGANPYAYCAADPVNRADPSGHLSWQAWSGISLGIAGLGLAAITYGTSIIASGGIIAALESASAVSLAIGGITAVADATAIASGAMEQSDPRTSAALGWVSLATGMLALGAGLIPKLGRLASLAKDGARFLRKIERGERGGFGIPLSGRGAGHFAPNNERYFMGISGDMAAFAYGEMLEDTPVLSVYGHSIMMPDERYGYLLFNPIRTSELHTQLARFVLGYYRYPVIRLDLCNSSQMARDLSALLPGRIVGGFSGGPRLGFNPEASKVISGALTVFRNTEGELRSRFLRTREYFLKSLPSNYPFNMDIDDQQGTYFIWYRDGVPTGRADITGVRTAGRLED
ncbi:RHS repeat-associated core domain-containing protein [Chromobacterium sp. ATCC 53434]|uniref:RHS repeat-associated core domain-containing protein n=1 Tax=Chromobacterium sp. (strain ATCC 53434 / SC 14030) TaxID=2059672 RepID=UPI0018F25C74|nr:RHS repeat-associated core domain-containing protein [Chromobacterium sp. ATCC 53434]